MKAIQFIQKLSFLTFLFSATGDTWTNLVVVSISAVVMLLTTLKLQRHGL